MSVFTPKKYTPNTSSCNSHNHTAVSANNLSTGNGGSVSSKCDVCNANGTTQDLVRYVFNCE